MRIAEIYSSLQGEGRLTGTPSALIRTSGCNLRCWFCDTPFTSWRPEGEDYGVAEIVSRMEQLTSAGGPWCKTWESLTGSTSVPELRHVIITGGEPMLFAELIPLTEQLRQRGYHLTIETSGTLFLPVACDLMSISPKLASSTPVAMAGRPATKIHRENFRAGDLSNPDDSRPENTPDVFSAWTERHERDRHQPAVIRKLIDEFDYQLKFVIDSPEDCTSVEAWLTEFEGIPADRVWLMPQGIDPAELSRTAEWLVPYCTSHGYHYCPRKHIEWFGPGRGT